MSDDANSPSSSVARSHSPSPSQPELTIDLPRSSRSRSRSRSSTPAPPPRTRKNKAPVPVAGSSLLYWSFKTEAWTEGRRAASFPLTVFPEERIVDSEPLDPERYYSKEDFDRYVKENGGKCIIAQEEKAREDLESNPWIFSCVYCLKNFRQMKSVRDHLFPRRARPPKDTKKWVLDCKKRASEEGLEGYVPKNIALPKRDPWIQIMHAVSAEVVPQNKWNTEIKEKYAKFSESE